MYYLAMTLGGANVWSNFSYGYRNESPSGWLLNPDRSQLILFTRSNKRSKGNCVMISAHTYHANDLGEPSSIKSSNLLPLDYAWNKWHDLQLEGWTFEELELPESA